MGAHRRCVTCGRVRAFALKHFLPIGLASAIGLGLSAPGLGAAVASITFGGWGVVQTVALCIIFLLSGLTLNTADVLKAIKAWPATLFGVVSILFITPLLALVAARVPFLSAELQLGFIIFCTMPTTVNSGVALTGAAGGSTPLALLLTVLSNMLGIFTVPFFLSLLLSLGGIVIDARPLLIKLILTLLVPLIVGKVAREQSPWLRSKVKAHKVVLSLGSSFCLLLIPWMKLSLSQERLLALSFSELTALLGVGLAIHLIYLLFNYMVAHQLLRLSAELEIAIVLMCSQKTLPMAMTVLSFLPASLGAPGLIAIPCILSHLIQLFVDAFLAARWARAASAAIDEDGKRAGVECRSIAKADSAASTTDMAPAAQRQDGALAGYSDDPMHGGDAGMQSISLDDHVSCMPDRHAV